MPDVQWSESQQRVLNFFANAIHFIRTGEKRDFFSRSLIVYGKAGSGKSTTIEGSVATLSQELGTDSYILLAQTGSAAYLIGGQTIHSKLKISVDRQLNSLSQRDLMELQEDLRNCYFVIIDEMSLIGCSLLKKIDIFTTSPSKK